MVAKTTIDRLGKRTSSTSAGKHRRGRRALTGTRTYCGDRVAGEYEWGRLVEVLLDVRHTPGAEPVVWRETSEGGVRALGMVRGEPEGERVAALFVAGEDVAGVDALALQRAVEALDAAVGPRVDRKSTRLNSSHV